MTETERANLFARNVMNEILTLRGYRDGNAPTNVVKDVFRVMGSPTYSKAFAEHWSPEVTAQTLQNAAWDAM